MVVFTHPERQELAKLVYDVLGVRRGPDERAPEPFMIKSKAATLMAELSGRRAQPVELSCRERRRVLDSARGLSALVMRYVAEDVAVYNSDIIGDA